MDFLFGKSATYTERHLVLLSDWPLWLQILVVVAAIAVVGLTIYNYRSLQPRWRRWVLIGLRSAVVVVLLAVFYQPAFLEENVTRSRNHVLVVADVSESMGLSHGDSTRAKLVARFLEDRSELWDELAEDNTLSFFAFGEEVEPLPDLRQEPEGIDAATKPRARQSRIVGALRALRERFRNRDLGGILMLTDGIDTTAAGGRIALAPAERKLLADLDAPVYAFSTHDATRLKDVAVADVAYNNFAFLMNVTSLDAKIRVHGYPVGTLTVRLTENGDERASRVLVLEPGKTDYDLSFEFVPRTLGKQVYAITADHRADEIYAKNNTRQVVINVIRDKIRVLQIVGQPSWDERFLRNHLESDPNIDLISFFILVNAATPPLVSAGETALIPFPAKELFEEELGGFDLAIFQNFNYGPFRTRQYLPDIAQYVRDGGAFLMVGGPLSLSAGGYYGTEITGILPVDIPIGIRPEDTLDTTSYRLQLSQSGRYHPITRLMQDPVANARTWGQMEALEGVNLVSRLKPDAIALGVHSGLEDETGKPMPVVAVTEIDKGRSMVVATDSTWHWSFKAGNAGEDPRHFDTFWSNAIKWLIKDPELDLIKVKVLRETIPVEEKASVRIEVYQADYRPATEHPTDIVVRLRGAGDGVGEGSEVLRLDGERTDGEGRIELEVPLDKPGVYEVEAQSTIVAGRVARGTDLFVATDLNPEFETVVGDGRLLDALAGESDGAVFPIDIESPELVLREPRIVKVSSRRHRELWNVPAVLLLLALLLTTEWSLRRKYGYL